MCQALLLSARVEAMTQTTKDARPLKDGSFKMSVKLSLPVQNISQLPTTFRGKSTLFSVAFNVLYSEGPVPVTSSVFLPSLTPRSQTCLLLILKHDNSMLPQDHCTPVPSLYNAPPIVLHSAASRSNANSSKKTSQMPHVREEPPLTSPSLPVFTTTCSIHLFVQCFI